MVLNGKGAAPGIAVGEIFLYKKNNNVPAESFVPAGEEQLQLNRYIEVKKQAINELEEIRLSMQKRDPQKAEIFKAHQEIVDDIVINEEIPARILGEHWSGDWAIYQVYETVLVVLRKTGDPLIAERAADFNDVRSLLLRLWYGEKSERLSALKEPVIIAAHDLMPSDTASMDKDNVLAILTETGGLTSHTAIIARSYGIPTVLGIQGLLDVVKQGQFAAVNADEGTVILEPEKNIADIYIKKSDAFRRDRLAAESFRDVEGRTADGVKIDIGLNIEDAQVSMAECVDSVGLFRTEFLYMGRSTLPSEDEQFSVYREVLECFNEKPVILRTLDIGGDKRLLSMEMPCEENPFLGNRALRFCFSHPEIFTAQIRACLRACVYGNLWLMLPMVASIDDIRKAKEKIASVKEELKKEGKAVGKVKIGIMIEIPSIALLAGHAAKEVDFASIGSNDLCQYLCAADRMNSEVEDYYQSYHPAMFKIIKETVSAFNEAGKPISICGELGSDRIAVPALIGLGMRKLSMGSSSVAPVKRVISSLTVKKAEEMAKKVLSFSTAAEVKQYLTDNAIN
jgi:phosphotransferase system enzyme I (PtsI)